jgi:hypothetical protein
MNENHTLARKLNPAYNAIETGDFKACIRHCEAKDIRNHPLVLALKAYAMERKCYHEILNFVNQPGSMNAKYLASTNNGISGNSNNLMISHKKRFDEILKLALHVIETYKPDANQTVHHLHIVLRNSGAWQRLVDMYGRLVKCYPTNVEFTESLFFWQLRLGRYDEVGKFAMSMAKTLGNDQYLGWCATILVYEAKWLSSEPADDSSPEDEKDAHLCQAQKKLAFAELLLRKLMKSNNG